MKSFLDINRSKKYRDVSDGWSINRWICIRKLYALGLRYYDLSSLHLLPCNAFLTDQSRRPYEDWRREGMKSVEYGPSNRCAHFSLNVWNAFTGSKFSNLSTGIYISILKVFTAYNECLVVTADKNEHIWISVISFCDPESIIDRFN